MARHWNMRIEYQKCRTWGHAWEDFLPGVGKRPASWGRRFSLRCERCHTERHDTFDARGELSTRSYDYPSDYACSAEDRPELTQLRLSLVRELKEQTHAKTHARAVRGKNRTAARAAPGRKATPRRLASVSN